MPSPTRPRTAVLLACLLTLASSAAARAEDKAVSVDGKALDRYLYDSLRFVINHGVDLYNANEVGACVQHFRRTLDGLTPLLAHRPAVKKLIETGLAEVDANAAWRAKMASRVSPTVTDASFLPVERQKAFALRAVLNDVRDGLRAEKKGAPKPGAVAAPAKPEVKKAPEKKPDVAKPGRADGREELLVMPAEKKP